MTVRDYIKATRELIEAGKDTGTVLQSLRRVLETQGRSALYPRILRGLMQHFSGREGTHVATVTVARESDISRQKAAIEEALHRLGEGTQFESHIDSTVIGGFSILSKDRIIDQTFKSKLLAVYRSLIGSHI